MQARTALDTAHALLLGPSDLAPAVLDKLLARLLPTGADDADIYLQHTVTETWFLEDGVVKNGTHSTARGAGLRTVAGEKTGFAYSDELTPEALADAAEAARGIVRGGGEGSIAVRDAAVIAPLYAAVDPLSNWPAADKLALMKRADAAARAASPLVTQVMVSMAGQYEVIFVQRADGARSADVRPLVRFGVSVIVERNGRREQGASGAGGRGDYLAFFGGNKPEELALEAGRQALVLLDAIPAPAGMLPVVLGSGWPGVLLHEAVGHTLEGDFNRKGSSLFSGRMGEMIVSPLVTVVDDGTLPNRRGSLTIDDEGTPTNCTTLIENGKLVGYIQDRLNARLSGVAPTGNGRRESFAHLPMPRMTNTYMRAGESDPADIIKSVKKGLYAVNFGGGQVDITSGNFVFSATEAYLIEDGKVTRPVKGATLIGNGPEALTKISMVGHDMALDNGVGVCGKEGQSVPVGVGQPTLKIDAMTVGGTQA
ncbi:MAG: metalloprotease TldD [Pseudomonadota bacterium]